MRKTLGLLTVLLLAGCLSPYVAHPEPTMGVPTRENPGPDDRFVETLEIQLTTSGPFEAWLPVPLAVNGSTLEDWVRNATWQSQAKVTPHMSERGPVLAVNGVGEVRVTSSVQGVSHKAPCCRGSYLDAQWSTAHEPTQGPTKNVTVFAEATHLQARLDYAGRGAFCLREASFQGVGLGRGWTTLSGDDFTICS